MGTKALFVEVKEIKRIISFTIENLARRISLLLRVSALVLIEMLFSVRRYIRVIFFQSFLTG